MTKVILYGMDISPPVRNVLLTLKELNLPFEYKRLQANESKSEEYLRINSAGTVPALIDNGHIIGDSHAIMTYLVRKYGKDDSLYPRDYQKRSIVDQRLFYEAGVAFERALRAINKPVFFDNVIEVPQSKIDIVAGVYADVNVFVQDHPYVAGDQLTIADFSLIATISSLQAYLNIDAAKYPALVAWIKRLEKLPYYEEANGIGAKQFVEKIKSKNIKIIP